jgi:hypothetical protein
MSNPVADPFSMRSNGGSWQADATIKVPGFKVSDMREGPDLPLDRAG